MPNLHSGGARRALRPALWSRCSTVVGIRPSRRTARCHAVAQAITLTTSAPTPPSRYFDSSLHAGNSGPVGCVVSHHANLLTFMPRAPTNRARTERDQAMRADRVRGWTLRKIAKWHGVSLAMAHRVVGHVHIQLLPRWHRARLPKEAPMPPCTSVHWLYSRDCHG